MRRSHRANDILGIEVQTEGENVLLTDPRSVSPCLTKQILPVLVDDTFAASPNLTAPNQTALLVEQPCTSAAPSINIAINTLGLSTLTHKAHHCCKSLQSKNNRDCQQTFCASFFNIPPRTKLLLITKQPANFRCPSSGPHAARTEPRLESKPIYKHG